MPQTMRESFIRHVTDTGKKLYCAKIITDPRPSFYKVEKGGFEYSAFTLHVAHRDEDLKEFLRFIDFVPKDDEWMIGNIWFEDMTHSTLEKGIHIHIWRHYSLLEIPTHLWRDTDREERKRWKEKK